MTNASFIITDFVLQPQYNIGEGIEAYIPLCSKYHWRHNSQTPVVKEPYRRAPHTLGHCSLFCKDRRTWFLRLLVGSSFVQINDEASDHQQHKRETGSLWNRKPQQRLRRDWGRRGIYGKRRFVSSNNHRKQRSWSRRRYLCLVR